MRLWEVYDNGSAGYLPNPERIERKILALRTTYGEDIPMSAFGMTHDFDTYPRTFINAIIDPGKQNYGTQIKWISPQRLIFQHDVGVKGLLNALKHAQQGDLPEYWSFPEGLFWICEGHHRTCLQIISGRKRVKALVNYTSVQDLDLKTGTPK